MLTEIRFAARSICLNIASCCSMRVVTVNSPARPVRLRARTASAGHADVGEIDGAVANPLAHRSQRMVTRRNRLKYGWANSMRLKIGVEGSAVPSSVRFSTPTTSQGGWASLSANAFVAVVAM